MTIVVRVQAKYYSPLPAASRLSKIDLCRGVRGKGVTQEADLSKTTVRLSV